MNAAATEGTALDEAQVRAIDAAGDGGALVVAGASGTGKSYALVRRAIRLAEAPGATVVLAAPSDTGVARIRAELASLDRATRVRCATFGELAFEALRTARPDARIEEIDDVRASLHFEGVGADLFALSWTEFVGAEIDPEITGLRAPERFAAAAFRLIRKLRAALVSPADFKSAGLRGATTFYANPPNFAGADLIAATGAKYRDSLRVGPDELERQRAREIDLVKILARLYESYEATLVASGCLTATDAVYEAVRALRADPSARERTRATFAAILVDDAQDLTAGQLALLEAIAREGLANVTLAGDDAQRTRSFAGARGIEHLKERATVIALSHAHRGSPRLELQRFTDRRDEARGVASEIARRVADGTAPERIAVVTRNLRTASEYANAILARDVPVDLGGFASLYERPAVADALAALWCATDPYRHDYLLRALQAPWLALSDASVAVLCGDANEPQPLLFELPGDDAADVGRRWDRRRDLRLGRNVTRGDVDALLDAGARERLGTFRAALARWERAARSATLPELATLVLEESALATLRDDARGRHARFLIARLADEIAAFAERDPLATLGDFLERVERVSRSEDDLLAIAVRDPHAVRVLDVEAAKGETFDATFVVDVRAGAWPRYYVPDAFLFMPSLGMIPKENVGDAAAARTAKFSYALYKAKLGEKYYAEDRRAFACATSRSRDYVCISVSGKATRGVSAPELFEELRSKLGR